MKIMTYLHIIGWASGTGLLKTLSVTRKWVYGIVTPGRLSRPGDTLH